ncbi:MAG TPA: STAS domain-containing protein [Dermatophilaceae bacterium]|nr:STAS domain-containing protein [Dermatophilaceae bacterium]
MTLARILVTGDGPWPVVSLSGEIDLSNVDELTRDLERSVANAAHGVVLDISEVSYLDSTGLRVVFRLARELRDRQQRLCLVVPTSSLVRRVLLLAGVDSVADVVADTSEVAAVQGKDS